MRNLQMEARVVMLTSQLSEQRRLAGDSGDLQGAEPHGGERLLWPGFSLIAAESSISPALTKPFRCLKPCRRPSRFVSEASPAPRAGRNLSSWTVVC
jgi:hypothetical protein